MSKQINQKVKTGDKVIVTHSEYSSEKFDVGQILTVAEVTNEGADLYPEGHNPKILDNTQKGCLYFYNQEFEVVDNKLVAVETASIESRRNAMSNFYKTVKLVNSMTKDDMAAVALELAATNPELFVQLASRFGFQVSKLQFLAEKVDAEAKSYRSACSLFVRRIKAYREITGAGLKEAKEWVEENFKDCGRGEPR